MGEFDRSSPWDGIDLASVGMTVPDPADGERAECRGWMRYAASAFRGQAYLYWAQLRAIGEFVDIAVATLSDLIESGRDERDLFDPYTVAVAEIGVLFAVPLHAARTLVGAAIAASERLPRTAGMLREGAIGQAMFDAVVHRSDIVDDPVVLAQIDTELAAALAEAGHISEKRASSIADLVVARHDPDAVRRRHEKAQKRKNVQCRDYGDGLAGVVVTADEIDARVAFAELEALAAGVCPNDPRTAGQRRSAAALARLRGLAFTCACDDAATCVATLSDEAVEKRTARVVVHAVCRKSTLDGENDEPGFLDGHGVIGADRLREIAGRTDTTVRDLDPDAPSALRESVGAPAPTAAARQPSDGYRPTATLEALVKSLFGECAIPGCERPAWNCELDHVEEFDALCPASGGPTCLCNLGPKCLRHHQLKTHLGATVPDDGWVDDQWIDADGVVWTSVTLRHGTTFQVRAPNQWLFSGTRGLRCPHEHEHEHERGPTHGTGSERGPGPGNGRAPRGGRRAATADKHAWRKAERARRRRERDRVRRRDGPPPF
ncbi:MAG: DUF222 domain-containing protein [Gordonia sp. (in: high G+C Gram-positive bacteria)]|uniref:HNH endonuclease signature motif containing protein n=1 Tax=Gordonia sp. (in: high G+C Gram-positive bacteria) TaxID=84139 RepID=UPI0039E729BC